MSAETPISEREREILRLVAMGATNQQIAQQLEISINTVKVHLRNIFGKIGVASRTEATVYAIRQGLVVVDQRRGEPPPAEAQLGADGPSPAISSTPTPTLIEAPPESALPSSDAVPTPRSTPTTPLAPAARRRMPLVILIGAAVALVALGGIITSVLTRPTTGTSPTPGVVSQASEPAVSQAARWRERAPLPLPRDDFAVAAYDGRLFVIGGRASDTPSGAVSRFDPTNNVWVTLNEKPTPAAQIQAVAIGRSIYVPGGEGTDGQVLDALEAYDPRSQAWETLPPLPAPRSRYALANLEGRLYLFGGWDGTSYRGEVFIFDPATRTWSEGDALPTARRDAGAAVVEGRIYVIGGESERGALRVNERYDPTGDPGRRWESAAPLSEPITNPAAVGTLDVALIFAPGRQSAFQYMPATDSWSQGAVPGDVSLSARAVFLGTSVYVFGDTGGALSEYQALFNTFLPGTTGE
jgi:DNA-binding CsgD family transcriptional regulator